MHARDLFLSDLPLHDQTADYLLLSEQRKTEADLKDRFERLAMELKVGVCCVESGAPAPVLAVLACQSWSTLVK